MGADRTVDDGRLRGADRPPSTVDATSKPISGVSTLAAGLGTTSAVAEMAKAFGTTSAWTSGMRKSFSGIDGRGASSALAEMAEMAKTMSGASTLAAGLGASRTLAEMAKTFGSTSAWTTGMGKSFTGVDVGRVASSAVAETSRSWNGTSLGRSFGAFDVGMGRRAAVSEGAGTISGAVAARGLPEAVELLTPALDGGPEEEQRPAFRAYVGLMLACVGAHMMLAHPTVTSIALTALAIVQVAWWMATHGSRWLP